MAGRHSMTLRPFLSTIPSGQGQGHVEDDGRGSGPHRTLRERQREPQVPGPDLLSPSTSGSNFRDPQLTSDDSP